MRVPDRDSLAQLAAWRPAQGVLSVYVSVDPGDRSERWRLGLNEQLGRLAGEAASSEHRRALAATADRIRAHFPAGESPSGRFHTGFVEVSAEAGRERWMSMQTPASETFVIYAPRPHLRPLVEALDEGSPVGIVAASAERVRLLEWAFGSTEEVDELDLGIWRGDWAERKAPVPRLGSRGSAVSASGKDQHDQRVEANRDRFLHESGKRVGVVASERGWRVLLLFGNGGHLGELAHALPPTPESVVVGEENLVNEERGHITDRVNAAVERFNREREMKLVERARSAALSAEGHGALGLEPTRTALAEARVAHLVIDAEHDVRPAERGPDGGLERETAEELIEAALQTGAQVTPVEGEAADALLEHGGVGALLRY